MSDFDPYVERLEQLPFVRKARFRPERSRGTDGTLEVTTPTGPALFEVELLARAPSVLTVGNLLVRRRTGSAELPLLVLSPHAGRTIGRMLDEADVNYVDLAGNCRLRIGSGYWAHVEGRAATGVRAARDVRLRAPGYQVLFGLLADPSLVREPVRTIAEAVGVGKTAAAETLLRLESRGEIARHRGRRQLVDPKRVTALWLAGYGEILRPSLLIGRFQPLEKDPMALEGRLGPVLDSAGPWAWGGSAAEYRLVGHYRGETTLLHFLEAPADLPKRLRALPAEDGSLVAMRAIGPLSLEGPMPHVAHPLLVYAELLSAGDERSREAAALLAGRHLRELV